MKNMTIFWCGEFNFVSGEFQIVCQCHLFFINIIILFIKYEINEIYNEFLVL